MSLSRLRVAAVALSVLLFGLLLAVATPYYQTNDDATMHFRSAGVVLTEEPSEFLLFTHPIIGLVLSWLYRWRPEWPWYPAHLLLGHLCVAIACGWLALRSWGAKGLMAATCFIVVVQSRFVWNLQFTGVAMLLGVFGILLLRRGETKTEWALGGLMVLWSPLVRYESFQACAAFGVALLIGDALSRKPLRRWIWIAVAVGFVLIAVPTSFRAYYSAHPEWNEFFEKNALKGLFTDSRLLTTQTIPDEAYAHSEISRVDVQAYQAWLFDDSDLLTQQNTRPLLDAVDRAEFSRSDLRRRLDRFGLVVVESAGCWMLLAGLLVIPMVRLSAGGLVRTSVVLATAIALFAFLLVTDPRIPDHVVSPLLVCTMTICILEIDSVRGWMKRRGARRLLAAGLLCAIGGSAVLNVHRSFVWQRQQVLQELATLETIELLRSLEGVTVVDVSGEFPSGTASVFSNPRETFEGVSLLLGATHALTPDYRLGCERLGIDRLYPELVGSQQLLLWQPGPPQVIAYYEVMQEKYDVHIDFERVLHEKGRDIVLHVIPGSGPIDPADLFERRAGSFLRE